MANSRLRLRGKMQGNGATSERLSAEILTATVVVERPIRGLKYAGLRLDVDWQGNWYLHAVQDIDESCGIAAQRPLALGNLETGEVQLAEEAFK